MILLQTCSRRLFTCLSHFRLGALKAFTRRMNPKIRMIVRLNRNLPVLPYPMPTIDSGNQQDPNNPTDATNGLRPDTTPLTGIQDATLGSPETAAQLLDARCSSTLGRLNLTAMAQANHFGLAHE